MIVLPIVHGIVLGGQEVYGELDREGNFLEIADPRTAASESLEPLTSTMALQVPCYAEITNAVGEAVGELTIGISKGRVVCTAIDAFPGHSLTGQLLRQLPLSTLVREASQSHLVHLRAGFAVRFAQGNPAFSRENAIEEAPRRRVLTDAFLVGVAETYRAALAAGLPPAVEVERAFGPTTPENARRWIMMARGVGYLGESLGRGRKGEVSPRNHLAGPED